MYSVSSINAEFLPPRGKRESGSSEADNEQGRGGKYLIFYQIVNDRLCFTLSPMGQGDELIMFQSTRSQQITMTRVTVICVV